MFGRNKKKTKEPQFNAASLTAQMNNFGLTDADLKDKDLLVRK